MNIYNQNENLLTMTRKLRDVRLAMNEILDEVYQTTFIKGYYIKNYKRGYDILKIIPNMNKTLMKWDISKAGRKRLVGLLQTYQTILLAKIEKEQVKIKTNINEKAIKIQNIFKKRIKGLYRPITEIVDVIKKLAKYKNVDSSKLFEVEFESAKNKDIKLKKVFKNMAHLDNFISMSEEGGNTKKNYGLNNFKTMGVFDNITINSISNIEGGCAKKTTSKKQDKIIENHLYEFHLISPISNHQNCGIECLKKIIPTLTETYEKIRKKYNIPTKTMISFEDLSRIYNVEILKTNDRRPLLLLNSQSSGEIDETAFNLLFIHKNHYLNINKIVRKSEGKKVKRGKLFWDIETRLTEDKIYIKSSTADGKPVITESRRLKDAITAIYYKPYKSENFQQLIFTTKTTTSSVRQFADWLISMASDNKFFNCIAHNGSRFDMYFFLASLNKSETMLSKMNLRGSSIIGMNFFNHEFRDSCCHLLNSLDNLCKSYKVATPKLKKFNYRGRDYTNEQLCFYKPSLSFNDFMSLENTEPEYWEIYTKYCMYDCISLSEVWNIYADKTDDIIRKMNPKLLLTCGVNTSLTVGSLAMKIMKGLHDSKHISFTNYLKFMGKDEDKYNFIKNFKRGGISHNNICGRISDGVCSVDITSQYPASMIYMEIPTGNSEWTEVYDDKKYGFYQLKNLIFGPDEETGEIIQFKPIAEVLETGVLEWNTGGLIKESFVDSYMLKYLMEHFNLESFEVVKGLVSNESVKGEYLFGRYVNTLFEEKAKQDILKLTNEHNPAYRETIKLFLNSITGKFVENVDMYENNIFTVIENKRTINGSYTESVQPLKKKMNIYMGCGVMIYSHSKRLIDEYVRCLPQKTLDVIHMETDSIYFHKKVYEEFKINVENYDGPYPVKFGDELGNIKQEKNEDGVCHFLGKKFYQIGDTFKIKGIPMRTITEDGSYDNIVDISIFERIYNGENVRVDYITLKKNLYGNTYISQHKTHRTINSHKNRYGDY